MRDLGKLHIISFACCIASSRSYCYFWPNKNMDGFCWKDLLPCSVNVHPKSKNLKLWLDYLTAIAS